MHPPCVWLGFFMLNIRWTAPTKASSPPLDFRQCVCVCVCSGLHFVNLTLCRFIDWSAIFNNKPLTRESGGERDKFKFKWIALKSRAIIALCSQFNQVICFNGSFLSFFISIFLSLYEMSFWQLVVSSWIRFVVTINKLHEMFSFGLSFQSLIEFRLWSDL